MPALAARLAMVPARRRSRDRALPSGSFTAKELTRPRSIVTRTQCVTTIIRDTMGGFQKTYDDTKLLSKPPGKSSKQCKSW